MEYVKNAVIILLLFFMGSAFAQDVETELPKIAVAESEMLDGFDLISQQFIDFPVNGIDQFKKALKQFWRNDSGETQQKITIEYLMFETIPETVLEWHFHGSELVYTWGCFSEQLIGDYSWIFIYDNFHASDIIKDNYALVIGVRGDDELNKSFLQKIVKENIFPKIEQHLSEAIKQELETKRQTRLTADTFDQLVPIKLSSYTKHDLDESKWLINDSDYVLGWRRQWTNESGKMIGIDIAKFAGQSDAGSALVLRQSKMPFVSYLVENPLDPQIPSKMWVHKYFIGFPSVLYSFKNYTVHVFTNNPYLRGDSTGTVDTLLFDIARDVAENIDALGTTGTKESDSDVKSPRDHLLSANWPNPFNPGTSISYTLTEPGEIELAVYDLRGARVATLAHGRQPAGEYTVSWDGRYESGVPAPSGTYFYRLTVTGPSGTITDRKKMTLVR